MDVPPQPPLYASHIRSDDPDEVTSWAARRDGSVSRVLHSGGQYGFLAAMLEGQRVAIGWGRNELGHTLRGMMRYATLQVPLIGPQEYRYGRDRITAAPGDLVFVAPGTEMSRSCGPGSLFVIDVDSAMLTEEMGLRLEEAEPPWVHYPRLLDVPSSLSLALAQAAAQLIDALDPDAPARRRLLCESWLVARLGDVLLVSRPEINAARLAIRRLTDLENWIDANLGEPITMARLCDVARTGERSLQLAFRARRGMSPMRFVLERRLTAAHRRLSRGEALDDVTSVATDLGFMHLGRFSIAYRAAYGEAPLRTLMRNRAR